MLTQQRAATFTRERKKHDNWRDDPRTMPWDRLRLQAIILKQPNVKVWEWEREVKWEENGKVYCMWFVAHAWSAIANVWIPFYIDLIPDNTTNRSWVLHRRKKRWAEATNTPLFLTKVDDLTEGRLRTFLMRLRRAYEKEQAK